jgi:hypothetical protein
MMLMDFRIPIKMIRPLRPVRRMEAGSLATSSIPAMISSSGQDRGKFALTTARAEAMTAAPAIANEDMDARRG